MKPHKDQLSEFLREMPWNKGKEIHVNTQYFYTSKDRRIVGMARVVENSDYCELQDVFVSEAERGNGIGRRLVELAIRHNAGKRIMLKTQVPQFYEKLGFKITSVFMELET